MTLLNLTSCFNKETFVEHEKYISPPKVSFHRYPLVCYSDTHTLAIQYFGPGRESLLRKYIKIEECLMFKVFYSTTIFTVHIYVNIYQIRSE